MPQPSSTRLLPSFLPVQAPSRLALCDGRHCQGALAVAMVTRIPPWARADWSLYPGCRGWGAGGKVKAGWGTETPQHMHAREMPRGEMKAIKMAPRPPRGRRRGSAAPGCRNPGGSPAPRRAAWVPEGAQIPPGPPPPASPGPGRAGRHTPQLAGPAPWHVRAGRARRAGLARSPRTRGRGAGAFGGVRAGRGGGRASNPRAACGSGRIRELAL